MSTTQRPIPEELIQRRLEEERERLARELGKPVISSASAMMWNALRVARVATPVAGFGSLLSGAR